MNFEVEDLTRLAIEYGSAILIALLIWFVGMRITRLLVGALKKLMEKRGFDATLISFLSGIAQGLLVVMVALAALGQLGVETTSFIAVLGAAGLAVGLALQNSLSNFAAGVMMIVFRPFKAGEFVEVAGTAGIVEDISIFTTRLRTGDNKTMFIPNGNIMSGNIVNYSAKPTRRVDMVFGISYDDDIRAAKQLIHDILNADERILKEPAPVVGVLELADSSVNFAVRPWVNSADYWNVYFAVHEQIKLRFDEAGISIPYPQSDIHVVSQAGLNGASEAA